MPCHGYLINCQPLLWSLFGTPCTPQMIQGMCSQYHFPQPKFHSSLHPHKYMRWRRYLMCLVHTRFFPWDEPSNLYGFDMEIEEKTTRAFSHPDNFAIGIRWLWLGSPNFPSFARAASYFLCPSRSGWRQIRYWTGVSSIFSRSTKSCEYLPILNFWLLLTSPFVGTKSPARRFSKVDLLAPLGPTIATCVP